MANLPRPFMPPQPQPRQNKGAALEVMLKLREQALKEKQFAHQVAIDQSKAADEAAAAALTRRKAELDLRSALEDNARRVGEAEAQTDALPTPSSLSTAEEGGTPQESQAFANIVSQNDPGGVLQGRQAEQNLIDLIRTGAQARQTLSGGTAQQAVDSTLGAARGASARLVTEAETEEAQRQLERREKVDDEIAKQRATAIGKATAVDSLQRRRNQMRKRLEVAQRDGNELEVSDLRERIQIYNGMLKQRERGILGEEPPAIQLTPGDTLELIQRQGMSQRNMALAEDYIRGIQTGEIKTGLGGGITSGFIKAQGIVNSILELDPNVGDDMASLLGSIDPNQSNVITFDSKLNKGRQVSVGLEELALAYAFVRGNRESARFTILELERTLARFKTTGALSTKEGLVSAAKKVFKQNARIEGSTSQILGLGGVDATQLDGTRILPQRQGTLDSFAPTAPLAPTAQPVTPQPTAPATQPLLGSDEEILQRIRQRAAERGGP